jgi:hypothetical protein
MMHGHEKSDPVIVAVKPANKAKELAAEASVPGARRLHNLSSAVV